MYKKLSMTIHSFNSKHLRAQHLPIISSVSASEPLLQSHYNTPLMLLHRKPIVISAFLQPVTLTLFKSFIHFNSPQRACLDAPASLHYTL